MFERKIRTEGKKMQVLGNYRLTNPRRLVRAVAVLALAAGLSVLGITGSVATNETPRQLDYLTVGQGDTLWSLAQDHATGDPRDWIAEVVLLNGLTTSELAPGQQIALP
jgi:LysM repeat protein